MLRFACHFLLVTSPLLFRLALFTSSGVCVDSSFFQLVRFKCLPHRLRGGGTRPLFFSNFVFFSMFSFSFCLIPFV